MDALAFAVLGPVRAWRDGAEVELGTPAQRSVLAVLILHDGAGLTTAELVAAVWDDPPRSADGLVRTYVSRLRQALGADVIEKAGGGYRIAGAPPAVDLRHAEDRFAAAHARREVGDLAGTVRELRAGLNGFGPAPLAGVGGPYLEAERRRLVQLRLDALEECLGLGVRLGAAEAVIGELSALAHRYPTRERLVRTCMVVLHDLGRTAEALECYHRTRRVLRTESGMAPGPGLQACFQNLLRDDGSAEVGPATSTRGGAAPVGLPRAAPVFAGREAELRRLTSLPAGASVSVDGMAGVGKTALVVRAATALADRHPDGAVFLDLRGHTEGTEPLSLREAADRLLRSISRPAAPGATEEQSVAAWIDAAAEGRRVIVLDNALDPAQVGPLLVGGRNTTLVTSRHRLVTLPVDEVMSLSPVDDTAARTVLETIVGTDRLSAESRATAELVDWCGGLPLALQLVAVRLRHRPAWQIDDLVNRLRDSAEALSSLAVDDLDVAAALDVSLDSLSPDTRQHLRVLASLPMASVGVDLVAVVVGGSVHDARAEMEDLLDRHLVTQTVHDRYGMHDVLRAHLRARSDPTTDAAAVDAAMTYFVAAAQIACNANARVWRPVRPVIEVGDTPLGVELQQREVATAWLEREAPSFPDAATFLAERGPVRLAWQFVWTVGPFCERTGRASSLDSATLVVRDAVSMTDDLLGQAHMRHSTALDLCQANRVPDGLTEAERALDLCRRVRADGGAEAEELDWLQSRLLELCSAAQATVGQMEPAWQLLEEAAAFVTASDTSLGPQLALRRAEIGLYTGRVTEAVTAGVASAAASEHIGNPRVASIALRTAGDALLSVGDTSTARKYLQRALDAATQVDDDRFQAMAMVSLSEAAALDGDIAAAFDWLQRADERAADLRVGLDTVDADVRRAVAHLAAGDVPTALAGFSAAAATARELEGAWEQARALHGQVRCLRRLDDAQAIARAERELATVVSRHGLGHPERTRRRVGVGAATWGRVPTRGRR